MSSEIIKLIENQKKIPIIGKGTSIDIKNKFNRLVLDKYSVIEITLRSNEALEVSIELKKQNPNINIGFNKMFKKKDNIRAFLYVTVSPSA